MLPLLFFFAACAREEASPRVVHRDIGGIPVVESIAPAWDEGEGWVAHDSPVLDLTEVSDGTHHEFFRATDATRLSDGSIVVGDDGYDEVRVFSPEGAYLRTMGRPGDGPGEFRRLDQIVAVRGDSILAYDYWQARLTFFTPTGEMARIVQVESVYRPRPLFPLSSGGFVGMSTDFTGFGDKAGLHRLQSPIVRVGRDGAVVDTLTTIPGYESVIIGQGDARAFWGKSGHLAVRGEDVYLGFADSLEYQVHSPDGRLQRIVRVPGYDLTLSDPEIRAERRAFLPDPANASPLARQIMEGQPDRSHRPGYGDLVVDVFGNVWLQEFQGLHEQAEPTNWQVFDAVGEWLGAVTLPPRFHVFRIGTDWILGRRPDELDVQHIQLLRLDRTRD